MIIIINEEQIMKFLLDGAVRQVGLEVIGRVYLHSNFMGAIALTGQFVFGV